MLQSIHGVPPGFIIFGACVLAAVFAVWIMGRDSENLEPERGLSVPQGLRYWKIFAQFRFAALAVGAVPIAARAILKQ